MTNIEQAVRTKKQHKRPCHDCPMRRNAIPGWLGGYTPEEYRRLLHSDTQIDCHALAGPQCAGAAIYRRNVVKRTDPPLLTLEQDHQAVFSTPMEFVAHHDIFKSRKDQP